MSCLSSSLRQPSRENIFLSTCTSWLRPKGLEIKMVQNSLATKGRNTTIPTFNNYHLCWLPPNIYFTSILRQIHEVGTREDRLIEMIQIIIQKAVEKYVVLYLQCTRRSVSARSNTRPRRVSFREAHEISGLLKHSSCFGT